MYRAFSAQKYSRMGGSFSSVTGFAAARSPIGHPDVHYTVPRRQKADARSVGTDLRRIAFRIPEQDLPGNERILRKGRYGRCHHCTAKIAERHKLSFIVFLLFNPA